jgi:hypothetical protein
MQIGQELLPRRAGPRAGRAQVDRDADLRGLKIIRAIRLRTPTAQQVIDIPSQPLRVHRPSVPLTSAGIRQRPHRHESK